MPKEAVQVSSQMFIESSYEPLTGKNNPSKSVLLFALEFKFKLRRKTFTSITDKLLKIRKSFQQFIFIEQSINSIKGSSKSIS